MMRNRKQVHNRILAVALTLVLILTQTALYAQAETGEPEGFPSDGGDYVSTIMNPDEPEPVNESDEGQPPTEPPTEPGEDGPDEDEPVETEPAEPDENGSGDEGPPTDPPATLGYSSIVAFAPLAGEVAEQEVPAGTAREDLELPDALAATVADGDGEQTVADIPVARWNAAPEYEPEEIGTYTFTPGLADGYTLEDSAALPEITVRVVVPVAMMRAGGDVSIDGKTVADAITDIQTAIDTATGGDVITVTGSLTGASETISLSIPTDVTVRWQATLTGGNGTAGLIRFDGGGIFEVAEGGRISSSNTAIYATEGDVKISGGNVSASSSYAVYCRKGNIEMTGGSVASTLFLGAGNDGGTVTVSGGTVRTTGTSSAIEIPRNASYNVVTIDGGTLITEHYVVDIRGDAGTGTVIVNGGELSNDSAYATVHGQAEVNGGRIIAARGPAIEADNGSVVVSGGEVIRTYQGSAIRAQSATVSGGMVFSYGEGMSDVITSTNPFTGPTGDGMVIAWDEAEDRTTYREGTNTHIDFTPSSAAAVWAAVGGEYGIAYQNGVTEGFVALPVDFADVVTEVDITGKMVAEAQSEIQDVLDDATSGEVLTVIGSLTGANTVTIRIPTGVTVCWKATLSGGNGTDGLIRFDGGGVFEVADGGRISSSGRAIRADEGDVKITGGNVSSGNESSLYPDFAVSCSKGNIEMTGGSVLNTLLLDTGNHGGTVTVSGGTVRAIGSLAAIQIQTNVNNNVVTIDGGTLISEYYVVNHRGSAEKKVIVNGGELRNNNSTYGTIYFSTGGQAEVYGGRIIAAEGPAIQARTAVVSGGEVISTSQESAINAYSATVSGGMVFSCGEEMSDVITSSMYPFTGPTGDGMVIAWDEAVGRTT